MLKLIFFNNFYRFIWIIISFLALIVNYVYQGEANDMEKNGVRSSFVISRKSCFNKSGSIIFIRYKNRDYSIGNYSSKKCYNLRIGSKIKLVYNEARNYFYVPGTMIYYRRMLYLSVVIFMLSLIPWELLYSRYK
jgi:hypothetical protein